MPTSASSPDPSPDWQAWVGRTETIHDVIAASQAAAVAATLDGDPARVVEGAALPILWHWFHFLPRAPQPRLAADGHPERGDFLPPIPLPRRMFAGARVVQHRPLRIGARAVRTGTIRTVTRKDGRSGPLAFVTVAYRIEQSGTLCIEEEQDIVYREPGAPMPSPTPATLPAPAPGSWSRSLVPDSRLLFRFSALTFNAHRIHYDRPYATAEEGYPGLVVHGPLIAVLLADLVARHDPRPLVAFRFKGLAPLFDGAPVRLDGAPDGARIALRAVAVDGTHTMDAEATLRP